MRKSIFTMACLVGMACFGSITTAEAGLVDGLFGNLLGGRSGRVYRPSRHARIYGYRDYATSYRYGSFGRFRYSYVRYPDGRIGLAPYLDSRFQLGIHR